MIQDYEKLGVFYLGRPFNSTTMKPEEGLLLYDSKDLLTHAICVGMTGSGKTGLCLGLLEEAAMDGIPAIAIDPKGDLANLMLTFPNLSAEEFAPWVNEEDSRKAGLSIAEYAQRQAELWKQGLTEWGQDAERIRRLRQAAQVAVYTPGSNAGLPLSIMKSFAAPGSAADEDAEVLGDRINGTVTGLLGLLNLEADPLQSREHILLSNLFKQSWSNGKDIDLGSLIQLVQNPPFTRVGVMEMETFFPSKERFELALRLNNLIAAPGFEAWLQGEPLHIDSLLHTPAGKPRIAILSIAHLNDAERMFFVSLLLNQVLAWVRTQSGTGSLRALLYMDEIFGFFPPVANPPSKAPLLALLKQARAFGLGVVLASQNPVDLDYKGLSNAGTWFIGRLQTERDKLRVLDGLEGAAAAGGVGMDRRQMEQLLSSLGKRVFLLHDVHEEHPMLFQTRWTLSYLRGPLTRSQIRMLMAPFKTAPAGQVTDRADSTASVSPPRQAAPRAAEASKISRPPILPEEIMQFFFPIRTAIPSESQLVYLPKLLGTGSVFFKDSRLAVDIEQKVSCLLGLQESFPRLDWQNAETIALEESELERGATEMASFLPLPNDAGKARNYEAWKKSLDETLYRTQKLELWRSPSLGEVSGYGEEERAFRMRLIQAMREARDRQKEVLRQKYAPKMAALEEKKRRAQWAMERQQTEAQQQKFQTAISIGSTLLGAFLGRKVLSTTNIGRAASSVRAAGRTWKESQDVANAEESLESIQQQVQELDAQFQSEIQALETGMDPLNEKLETIILKPKKSDIVVSLLALAWLPCLQDPQGNLTPAWP